MGAGLTRIPENLRVFWKRMGNSDFSNHEDHIAGKGENSLQHYNLVHKFILMRQVVKNSSSKSSGGQGMGKIEENFGAPCMTHTDVRQLRNTRS